MKIDSFSGEYQFLSNFWPSTIVFETISYPTAEHAYQAYKTMDTAKRSYIATLDSPGKAKRAGREIILRSDWDKVKVEIMYDILRQKFSISPLKEMLFNTLPAELIEGNTWKDRYWGVYKGKGKNALGRLLMTIREEIRRGEI